MNSGTRRHAEFAYVPLGLRLGTIGPRDHRIPSWVLITADWVRHPAMRAAILAAPDLILLWRVKVATGRRSDTPTRV